MRQLKLGASLTEHGINFKRLQNGGGRFSINIMVNGKWVHRVIGNESSGTMRTQAKEFIQKNTARG